MSTYRTTPSLIPTGTFVVFTTELAIALGGFQASAEGAPTNSAVRAAAERIARRVIVSGIEVLLGSATDRFPTAAVRRLNAAEDENLRPGRERRHRSAP